MSRLIELKRIIRWVPLVPEVLRLVEQRPWRASPRLHARADFSDSARILVAGRSTQKQLFTINFIHLWH
jgi:hypothetical protein